MVVSTVILTIKNDLAAAIIDALMMFLSTPRRRKHARSLLRAQSFDQPLSSRALCYRSVII